MDNLTATSRVRVCENVIIHVKRTVPLGAGKIVVHEGDEVHPWDVLGSGQSTTGFRVLHLAKELKVNPKALPGFLKRKIGQNIYQGELLAENPGTLGFGKKVILSPVDGVIDFYDQESGDLRFKLLPKASKVASGVFGIIDKIDAARGEIVIRTQASLVYGVFGSGKEREGLIEVLGGAGDLVSSKQLSAGLSGKIVIGGGMIFIDAVQKAANIGVSGFISGGMNAEDYKATNGGQWNPLKKRWADVGLSLVVTEGFGAVPLGEDIFGVLEKFHGRYGIVDGNRARVILPSFREECMIDIRKTKLPIRSGVEPTCITDTTQLGVGQKVRVLSSSQLGVQGVIEAIDRSPTKIASGLQTYLVTVAGRQQKLRVPFENLEII